MASTADDTEHPLDQPAEAPSTGPSVTPSAPRRQKPGVSAGQPLRAGGLRSADNHYVDVASRPQHRRTSTEPRRPRARVRKAALVAGLRGCRFRLQGGEGGALTLLHRAQLHPVDVGVGGNNRVDGGGGAEGDVDGSGPARAEAGLDACFHCEGTGRARPLWEP